MDKQSEKGSGLYRFPPEREDVKDNTFLCGKSNVYAKFKSESVPGKRTVFMTEHTLIFVLKGIKLLHFGEQTVDVAAHSVILLRKGIYVMAEYIEDGLHFEAMMIFLPLKLLQTVAYHHPLQNKQDATFTDPYVMVNADQLTSAFKEQFRNYFEVSSNGVDEIIPLKQQEILHLLLIGKDKEKVNRFIRSLTEVSLQDIRFIVEQYLFQPVSLPELSHLCNRSLASFKRDFKLLYKESPRQWINAQRLKHAYMLLENTHKTIAEVGWECGFENTSYFTRLFKKRYHHLPRALKTKSVIV